MGKVRKKRKNTFQYNVDRKKLKRREKKKTAPRITCDELRKAWDDSRSVATNLSDMGLAADPNKALTIQADTDTSTEQRIVRKPYVLKELKAAASLPSKKTMGISSDMVFYVRHMVENYGEDYKLLNGIHTCHKSTRSYSDRFAPRTALKSQAMARDEKNYYQDTPKQIQRKVNLYRRHHPDQYKALITSGPKP